MGLFRRIKIAWIEWLARYVVPCNEITHQLSDSRHRRLTWRERLAMHFHMSICVWCRRYKKQLGFIEDTVHNLAAHPDELPLPTEGHLSNEMKERIRRAADDASA